MVILSNNDMFEVRINSLLADYDRDTLTNLYQPIIGYTALAIYFTLWSEAMIQKVLSLSSHEQLFIRMKIAPGNFIEARKLLEAVGLVKTRLEKLKGTNIYHYELMNPKTPKGFFSDTLLYGMFIQALGESDAERIKRVYEVSGNEEDEGEDISSTFNEVFHPDFEDNSFLIAANSENKTVGRNQAQIETEFSYEKFFDELANISQISDKALSKKEMKEIERLASLYNIDEATAARVVSENYDSSKDKGERLDIEKINQAFINEANYTFINKHQRKKSQVSSDTQLASKINWLENTKPIDVLRILQGGTKVAPADIKIIEILSKDYDLSNGVINVIIDFVLTRNNNVLSRSYCEKVAASFNREGIETVIDAMNYLNNILSGHKKSKKSKTKRKSENEDNIEENNNKESSNGVSKEEWDELFEDEEKGEKGDGTSDGDLPF